MLASRIALLLVIWVVFVNCKIVDKGKGVLPRKYYELGILKHGAYGCIIGSPVLEEQCAEPFICSTEDSVRGYRIAVPDQRQVPNGYVNLMSPEHRRVSPVAKGRMGICLCEKPNHCFLRPKYLPDATAKFKHGFCSQFCPKWIKQPKPRAFVPPAYKEDKIRRERQYEIWDEQERRENLSRIRKRGNRSSSSRAALPVRSFFDSYISRRITFYSYILEAMQQLSQMYDQILLDLAPDENQVDL